MTRIPPPDDTVVVSEPQPFLRWLACALGIHRLALRVRSGLAYCCFCGFARDAARWEWLWTEHDFALGVATVAYRMRGVRA